MKYAPGYGVGQAAARGDTQAAAADWNRPRRRAQAARRPNLYANQTPSEKEIHRDTDISTTSEGHACNVAGDWDWNSSPQA